MSGASELKGDVVVKASGMLSPAEIKAQLQKRGLSVDGGVEQQKSRLCAALDIEAAEVEDLSTRMGGSSRKRPHSDIEISPAASKHAGWHSLLDQLECPVCMEIILPPIFQCDAGHLICEACKSRLTLPKKCLECRTKLGDTRNRVLEKLAEHLDIPCPHRRNGCEEIIKYGTARDSHAKRCEFRDVPCPNCDWSGSFSAFHSHKCTCDFHPCSLGRPFYFRSPYIFDTAGAFATDGQVHACGCTVCPGRLETAGLLLVRRPRRRRAVCGVVRLFRRRRSDSPDSADSNSAHARPPARPPAQSSGLYFSYGPAGNVRSVFLQCVCVDAGALGGALLVSLWFVGTEAQRARCQYQLQIKTGEGVSVANLARCSQPRSIRECLLTDESLNDDCLIISEQVRSRPPARPPARPPCAH